jgi:hypothetical protein
MQFKIHVSTEQKQTKNKRFMALSSNNFVTSNSKTNNRIRTMCIYHNLSDQLSCSEYVCTQYPSHGFGVHVALWVCLYTLPLPCASVHPTPPLGLVFMLLCESVCTHSPSPVNLHTIPSPGFDVHVALWVSVHHYPSPVSLYTLLLPWVWCSCWFVSLSVHKGNNKITELRTILQRESQNS